VRLVMSADSIELPSINAHAYRKLMAAWACPDRWSRDAAVIEQSALAAEIDAAEKLIAAGTSIGPEIARRLEVWTTGEGEDGPDLLSREELEPLRKSYKLALAGKKNSPATSVGASGAISADLSLTRIG
jgi:hypothetical protein